MSPADQPPAIDWRRSTEPPTLWLSLALGSVLIHLVFFILISVVLTRTAKVAIDTEPITVEFVDPNANPVEARSTAPKQVVAGRPIQPTPTAPTSRQAPLTTQIPQTSVEPKRSVEQPPLPLQPIKRNPLPLRTQQPVRRPLPAQTPLATNSTEPQSQPTPSRNPFPQQAPLPGSAQTQPDPDRNQTQTGLPGSAPNPSDNSNSQPSGSLTPVESGNKITLPTQGESASVVISNPRQKFDRQKQPAKPMKQQQTIAVSPPSTITSNGSIRIQTSLEIASNGLVLRASETKLLSPMSSINPIKQADLDDIANQIFRTWAFEPALDAPDGIALKPQQSTLIIDAEIQFP